MCIYIYIYIYILYLTEENFDLKQIVPTLSQGVPRFSLHVLILAPHVPRFPSQTSLKICLGARPYHRVRPKVRPKVRPNVASGGPSDCPGGPVAPNWSRKVSQGASQGTSQGMSQRWATPNVSTGRPKVTSQGTSQGHPKVTSQGTSQGVPRFTSQGYLGPTGNFFFSKI